MIQKNPFPDFVPKVGDVVRIGRKVWFQETTMVDRFGNFSDMNDPFMGISVFILGPEAKEEGFYYPRLAQYFWDSKNKVWQLNEGGRNLNSYTKEEGFDVEIVKRAS